ncbi:MAG TPA: YhjD/YihY/BrkB family envelope integrity protein [Streptosporangiaceae bacterium]|nr:YhjD/YihY/BrkB family envelope integrity protein [Streptosporangiaceae bacterium]
MPAWRKALAAARDWFDGSVAQDVVRELKALDFSNLATLFGAGLLASLLPFLILLTTFASARVGDYIALRLGLNHRAAGVVNHLFGSSHISLNAATIISVLFIITGTLAVANSLQQIYEKAFHLSHRSPRGLLRLPVWIVALCLTVTLETAVVRPVSTLPAGLWLIAVVTFVIMTAFFWWTIHFLLEGRIPWRTLLPPAVVTGILFAGFGVFSRFYFSRTIISNSKLYGAIGAVFGIMTWLIATGAMIILGAVAGAVWQDRSASRGRKRIPENLYRTAILLCDNEPLWTKVARKGGESHAKGSRFSCYRRGGRGIGRHRARRDWQLTLAGVQRLHRWCQQGTDQRPQGGFGDVRQGRDRDLMESEGPAGSCRPAWTCWTARKALQAGRGVGRLQPDRTR